MYVYVGRENAGALDKRKQLARGGKEPRRIKKWWQCHAHHCSRLGEINAGKQEPRMVESSDQATVWRIPVLTRALASHQMERVCRKTMEAAEDAGSLGRWNSGDTIE